MNQRYCPSGPTVGPQQASCRVSPLAIPPQGFTEAVTASGEASGSKDLEVERYSNVWVEAGALCNIDIWPHFNKYFNLNVQLFLGCSFNHHANKDNT